MWTKCLGLVIVDHYILSLISAHCYVVGRRDLGHKSSVFFTLMMTAEMSKSQEQWNIVCAVGLAQCVSQLFVTWHFVTYCKSFSVYTLPSKSVETL